MAFEWKDVTIYDELWDVIPVAAVVKGQAAVIEDVFGFYMYDANANVENVFVYRCRQVLADKLTGTGEDIKAGEKLYYYPAQDAVSPTPVGTAGTDYYFCGWAKRDAGANDTTVLMNFDGTRWNEAI